MPSILVPSSAKRTATKTSVIAKLNDRKVVCDIIRPSKELPAQSSQLKLKNKV